MAFYSRKSPRIPGYDYSSCNYYFITICTHEKRNIFGSPNQLNDIGIIVDRHIGNIPGFYKNILIDKFVVMPNHVHMILVLNDGEKNPSVSLIVGQFKRGVTMEVHRSHPEMEVWQRSFHDHVIRNQAGYEKIWQYIDDNPRKWEEDCFYIHE